MQSYYSDKEFVCMFIFIKKSIYWTRINYLFSVDIFILFRINLMILYMYYTVLYYIAYFILLLYYHHIYSTYIYKY